MKHKYTSTAKELIYLVLIAAIVLAVPVSWAVNLYKLTKCDFESSWKGEIIHAVGLIPIASLVTVWNSDK